MYRNKEIDWDKHVGIDPRILEPFTMPALFGFSLLWIDNLLNHPDNIIPWAISGATVYILSSVADTSSTFSALPDLTKAKELGLDYREAILTAPDVPTIKDFFKTKPLAVEIGTEVVSILIPPMSFIVSAHKSLAAINNIRIRKHIKNHIKKYGI